MQISKPDIRKLNALAEGLDSLLSDINLQIKLLNQSQGIEYEAFLYTLDITEIPSEDKGWALPSSYERDRVVTAVLKLRELWDSFRYWLYDGELIPGSDWQILWNDQAIKWNKPLLLDHFTKP